MYSKKLKQYYLSYRYEIIHIGIVFFFLDVFSLYLNSDPDPVFLFTVPEILNNFYFI